MVPKIERVTEHGVLGEGPHWNVETQSLYYVDVFGGKILRYHPASGKLWKASVAPRHASIIIPIQGKKEEFLVALNNELVLISWDGKSDNISILETLYKGGDFANTEDKSFNDAKCDSSRRLWIGTYQAGAQDPKNIPPTSFLYSFDSNRHLKEHVDKIQASNGLAFNEQANKFYYIDTPKNTVDQFDFDLINGTIANRQVLFTVNKHNLSGFADGMTIDEDGNLWVAIFGAGKIIKIDGKKPETLLEEIQLPAIQITSATFGGPNLDELYVTTASFDFGGQGAPPPPVNGATYRITGTGSKGLPANGFKLD